ncbi:hypothetical protein [Neisseria montereyensis]|uniref:DUF3592 domain-containing protein n=1 Tax=Neisseria montereyensis TaxID=2973938 RepID=A0ABT2FA33_9NEIS|nr:hypothetical protein [Neisseria montereyensis]MCS4533017.1 hypothetical protein [Neisseria montereyensis]
MKKDIQLIIILGILFLILVFIGNPIRWIIYGVVGGSLLFLMGKDKSKKRFLVSVVISYLLIAFLISISPYLKIKDFQLFHPNYEQLTEYQITDAKLHYGGRRPRYTYVTIKYAYSLKGKAYEQTEKEPIKWSNSLWLGSVYEREKLSEIIKEKDFLVFVNRNNPSESKMFYSNKLLYLSGSRAFQDIFYLLESFTVLLIGIALFGFGIFIYVSLKNKGK